MKIYNRQGVEIHDITVDDSSCRYRSIMNDDSLTLNFSLPSAIEIPQFSFCVYEGARYMLWRPSEFKKNHSRDFEYTVTMHGWREHLKMVKYKDMSATPFRAKFSLTAKPVDMMQNLAACLNNHDSVGGWSVGDCLDAPEKVMSFNHESCLEALGRFAQEWETEYEFEGKKIHLRKVEKFKDDPLPLAYGKGKGFLPGVGRYNDGDKQPVGRLFVQGGERNIDRSKYGSPSLLLPKSATLLVENKTYRTDADGVYITRDGCTNIAEDSYDGADIYPKRVGTVSSVVIVDADKHFYDIIDESIPELLNYGDCRIAGEKAVIKFESGALAGREFDIEQTENALTGYIHAERRFKIVSAEIDGYVMPGGVFVPAVGDKYAIFNINLPQAYISDDATQTGASWDMFREAARYFGENEADKFRFTGELDGVWSKSQWLDIGGKITQGGHVLYSDEQYYPSGVVIRIVGVKDYVNKPHKPEITLSNAPVSTSFASELANLEAGEVVVEEVKKEFFRFSKRQWHDIRQTLYMLSNSLLNFSSSINPITVQTMQLIVGDESLQFRFVNNTATPSQVDLPIVFNSQNKTLTANTGILQHMTIGVTEIKPAHAASAYKYWNMPRYVSPALPAAKAYYLYAKCSRSSQSGTFVLSETAIGMNGVAGHYHFLVGILNSEFEGDRSFVRMYGFTEILPGRITTDKIVSQDGYTYFDLLNGIIAGNIKFISTSGEEVSLGQWANDVENNIAAAVTASSSWEINASSPVIYKNSGSASAPGLHTTVTVKGVLKQGETSTDGGFITVTANGNNEASVASASPFTITPGNNDGKTSYTVRLYNKSNKEKLLDTQTIPVVFKGVDGIDSLNVILTNEADVLPATADGLVTSYANSGTDILVYEGNTELEYDDAGNANGKYNVTAVGVSITPGTKQKVNKFCRFNNASNMTADNAVITFTISGKTQAGVQFSITKVQNFSKSKAGEAGLPGSSAPLLILSSSSQVMQCDENNNAISGQTITIEAKSQNISGNVSFIARAYDDEGNFIANQGLAGSGNTRTLTNNEWAKNYRKIEITATLGALSDKITIYRIKDGVDGQNSITGFLTNESVTLPADSNGNVSSFSGASGVFIIYDGNTLIADAQVSFSIVANQGASGSITSSGSYRISSMNLTAAYIEFKAAYKGVEIVKRLTIAKSIAGQNGRAVIGVDVEFAQTTSATTAPTSGWETTAPQWISGRYIWTRTKTTYSEGNPTYTNPVNLTGSPGANGLNGQIGQGVESITEEYYLSLSKTQLIGGVWTAAPPTWEMGKYVWTRVKIVYKNPTSVAYTTPICDSSWDAVNQIEVGGVNLIRHSDFTKTLDGVIPLDGASKFLDANGRCAISKPSSPIRAKFLNVELKANKTYLFHCDEWWGRLGGVGFDDGQSSIQFTEIKRESLSLESGTRGFYKIRLSADKTGAVVIFGQTGHSDVRIKRPMLEQATHPSNYEPSPLDADEAITNAYNQANAANALALQASAITNQFTSINGGLIYSVMMLLRDLSSAVETAGISGIQGDGGYSPSYFSGGTLASAVAFGELMKAIDRGTVTNAHWNQDMANIVMLHNGHAKVGSLIVMKTGQIVMYQKYSIDERFVIAKGNITPFDTAIGGVSSSNQVNNTSVSVYTTNSQLTLANTLRVPSSGSIVRFQGRITASHTGGGGGLISGASTTIELYKNNEFYAYIDSVSAFNQTNYKDVDIYVRNCDPGTYSIRASYAKGDADSGSGSVGASILSYNFTAGSIRRTELGLNGLMCVSANNHIYFEERKGLDIKGTTNMPGVLLSATVNPGGSFMDYWGNKKHDTETAIRNSVGRYTIYHKIGHTQYHIAASPRTMNRAHCVVAKYLDNFVIEWRMIGSSTSLADTAFDVIISGDNYTPAGRV